MLRAIAQEEADFRELSECFTAKIGPMRDAEYQLQVGMSTAFAATKKLRSTYRGPLISELARNHAEQGRMSEELNAAQDRRKVIRWHLQGPVTAMRGLPSDIRKKLETERDEVDANIIRLESAVAEIRGRAHLIEQAMLEP